MELIKIVIADPDALLREGLKRIFSVETDLLVVGEAGNETEAVEIVRRTHPDLLLVELNLPRRGAVPLLAYMNHEQLATKAFVLSLAPDKDSILDAAKSGAWGYALKRTSPAALVQAIKRVHLGEYWADKHVNCAESFVELARQARNRDPNRLENEAIGVLSKREFEILDLVAKGLTNYEISKGLFISLRTVKVHLYHVFTKLKVNNRTQAALLLMNCYRHEALMEAAVKKSA